MRIEVKIRKEDKIYTFRVDVEEEKSCKAIISGINEEKIWFLNEIKRVMEEVLELKEIGKINGN